MVMADDVPQKDSKGRFVTGNSGGGRPKGSRNKLSEDFISDYYQVWQERGIEALREMPYKDFVKVGAYLIPKEVSAEVVAVSANLFASVADFAQAYEIALEHIGVAKPKPKLIDHD
jgi:hypothetical protein